MLETKKIAVIELCEDENGQSWIRISELSKLKDNGDCIVNRKTILKEMFINKIVNDLFN